VSDSCGSRTSRCGNIRANASALGQRVPNTQGPTPNLNDLVTDAWFTTLAAQLRRFRTERVDILLVDVGSNSGGNDSGEWTPRLLTPKAVRSARLLMSAAPVAQTYFDEQIAAIKTAQGSDSTAGLQAKAQQSLAFFAAASADLANRHCDMSWVWQEQRAV